MYSNSIFNSNASVYRVKISHTNVIQDMEQRSEKSRHNKKGLISGDVKVSIYCDHQVLLTLSSISLARIESHFVSVLCHSCCTYWLSWSNDWDGGWCWRTPLPNSSERCSIGVKFGDFEGHGYTWMLFRIRRSKDTLAAWGGHCPAEISLSVGQ